MMMMMMKLHGGRDRVCAPRANSRALSRRGRGREC
jgi:hypothetical protein